MRRTLTVAALAAFAICGAAEAGHNNPWTEDTSILLMQHHDENLAQSESTRGEDEMLGVMVQQARGKLDPTVGAAASGDRAGTAPGAGGARGRR